MDSKEQFYRQFQCQVADTQARISQLGNMSVVNGERKKATDGILSCISKLSLEVADASDFIPAYDQRTYSATVKTLTEELNAELTKLAPAKPRFQFKRAVKSADAPASASAAPDNRLLRGVPDKPVAKAKPQPGATAPTAESGVVGVVPAVADTTKDYNARVSSSTAGIRRPSFSCAREVKLSGHSGVHVILPPSASSATAYGSLTDLVDCVIDMSAPTASTARGGGGAPFQSLMLRNIEGSLILAGHVQGAVHITGLKNCVVVVAARQVRIHECDRVDVYLQCGSRPIIEDCQRMRFAPLPSAYADEEAGEGAGDSRNQWDQVDDFKWLRSDASPNWSVMPEAERQPERVWVGIVAGAPEYSVAVVLKAVGIERGCA
ncbi:hypothetical protein SEPCBS119000_001945 [Sporothrix epigloea]|uniref:C-CAP/cofactor C-like domain-containing protein n=1 Tax=Sporothrix epigloea TaxID=1892477 RepID=A0ABP0DDG2_9PEZI